MNGFGDDRPVEVVGVEATELFVDEESVSPGGRVTDNLNFDTFSGLGRLGEGLDILSVELITLLTELKGSPPGRGVGECVLGPILVTSPLVSASNNARVF